MQLLNKKLNSLKESIENNPKAKIRIDIKNAEQKVREDDKNIVKNKQSSIEEKKLKLRYSF